MDKSMTIFLIVVVGAFMIPGGSGFLGGGSLDPRCYLQTCNISMITLMNTVEIKSSLDGSDSGSTAAITESEQRTKTNISQEVAMTTQNLETDITNATDTVSLAIANLRSEILASISDECAPGFMFAEAMSIDVILDVYSGISNPTWSIPSSDGNFNPILTAIQQTPSTQIPALAGYRGFRVTLIYSDDTHVAYTYGQGQQADAVLETLLLVSSGIDSGSKLFSVVLAALNGQAPPDLGFVGPLAPESIPNFNPTCRDGAPCTVPSYLPSDWTSEPLKQLLNNGYNYAINLPSYTFPRPGGESTALTGEAIRNGNVQEGMEDFVDPAPGAFPVSTNCLTALVIMEDLDFHYYRLDADGTWSHKLGGNAPTNLDNSGATITDPRTADIGPYQFVRFLGICPAKFIGFT